MSGFAYRMKIAAAMSTPPQETKEAAGKIGRFLPIVATIFMPFAAPAIWASVAGSAGILSGLGAAMNAGFGATLASTIGSAAIGALGGAAAAYAGGARGGDVWRAAAQAAISSGGAAYAARALPQIHTPGAPVTTAATSGAPSAIGYGPVGTPGGVSGAGGPTNLVAAPPAATGGSISNAMMTGIRSVFGNVDPQTMRQIGAALVNAAVNGQDMGRLNALRDQQLAELNVLKNQNAAAYAQRLSEAMKISSMADRMDPQHSAYQAMADAAGIETSQFMQTMRNLLVRQGGMFDRGQQKSYTRSANLHKARTMALAYGNAYDRAKLGQAQMSATAAGLMTPDTHGLSLFNTGAEIQAGTERAHREASTSNAGGFMAALGQPPYKPATSAVPNGEQDQNQEQPRDAFNAGLTNPFGPQDWWG